MNRGRVCNDCLEVFEHDGDSWTFNHREDVALRQKIQDARRGYLTEQDPADETEHDPNADPCPHCEKVALDQALAAMQRALRGAT